MSWPLHLVSLLLVLVTTKNSTWLHGIEVTHVPSLVLQNHCASCLLEYSGYTQGYSGPQGEETQTEPQASSTISGGYEFTLKVNKVLSLCVSEVDLIMGILQITFVEKIIFIKGEVMKISNLKLTFVLLKLSGDCSNYFDYRPAFRKEYLSLKLFRMAGSGNN